ncbi:hypothetical protein ElyMa_001686500 [Elysia marginata]|uniref:ZP domain-containing protein n=1 Tax=Elysia marginata TaxID=1093978 RepID=A0AAV4JWT3_9GAST|nr:hypothetical protein ElyMa_001686500 [Elysia marginata]
MLVKSDMQSGGKRQFTVEGCSEAGNDFTYLSPVRITADDETETTIFSTQDGLDRIVDCSELLEDETFKSTPKYSIRFTLYFCIPRVNTFRVFIFSCIPKLKSSTNPRTRCSCTP